MNEREDDPLAPARTDMATSTRSPDTSAPLAMVDVVRQIQAIADLAEGAGDPALLEACRRAQSLLARLRDQFLFEVTGPGSPAGVSLVRAVDHTEAAESVDAA